MKQSDLNNHYSREENNRIVAILVAVASAVVITLIAIVAIWLLK